MEMLTSSVFLGPLLEQNTITAGLDYYKPTMSQLQYEKEPAAEVTFTLKNRGEQRLADYINTDELQQRLDYLRERGWQPEEIAYLGSLRTAKDQPVFTEAYLGYLTSSELPRVGVLFDQETQDIAVAVMGDLPLATFWETIVMSEVNEAYFEGYVRAHNLDLLELYEEGNERLSEKIATLQANPRIKFADFGTRRHFSMRWQKHVLSRLAAECPNNLIGTSNVALANALGIKPIGTFAHEMPMVYAGLADCRGGDIRNSHGQFLNDWYDYYGPELSIALTDTFTTDFFFSDFTQEQAEKFRGTRHDSGNPLAYGERVIAFYENLGIDPTTKTVVFSDGLDIDTIVALQRRFEDRITTVFGWGTSLMNDLGLPALNIVMKATHIRDPKTGNEADLVKLSDNAGKHTGPVDKVAEYQGTYFITGAIAA